MHADEQQGIINLLGVTKNPVAKRTKAEALVNNFGATGLKVAALDLQEFSTADRDMIMAGLASLQSTLNEAFDRVAKEGNIPA